MVIITHHVYENTYYRSNAPPFVMKKVKSSRKKSVFCRNYFLHSLKEMFVMLMVGESWSTKEKYEQKKIIRNSWNKFTKTPSSRCIFQMTSMCIAASFFGVCVCFNRKHFKWINYTWRLINIQWTRLKNQVIKYALAMKRTHLTTTIHYFYDQLWALKR